MKDPAFLFYTQDFLTGTYLMDDEQVGKYIRLLCIQHQKGKLSEKDMLKICNGHDEDIFQKFKMVDGYYINTRLAEESEKRKKYAESRRNNRKKKDTNNTSLSYEKHMSPHMENEDENEIVDKEVIKDSVLRDKNSTIKRMQTHTEWHNTLSRNTGIDMPVLIRRLNTFLKEQDSGDGLYRPVSELKPYFKRWVEKKERQEVAP